MNGEISESPKHTLQRPFNATAPHQVAKMKILVLDDEPANVALLEEILGADGFSRVKTITDPRTALETIQQFQPDLLLLDLMMPHVDGLSILAQLRAEETGDFLPVLVLTADINEETKLRALQAGATDFLLKPFDQLEVLLRIANLLEVRRLHAQLDMQRAAFEESLHTCSSELAELKRSLAQSRRGLLW